MEDSQIGKLVGTTKPTIQSIRNRSHWNISSIQPVDPVALGLCTQVDLDAAVTKAAAKKAKAKEPVPSAEERISLMSTETSLNTPEEAVAHRLSEFGNINLGEDARPDKPIDPDALFNLPKTGKDDDDEEET